MSWYADTEWDLTFRSAADWEAFVAEAAALARERGWSPEETPTPDRPALILDMCGEREDEPVELDGLRLTAATWGKWFGDDVLHLAAEHADGTVDFAGDGGERFRLRLHDGTITHHHASITYPGDTLDPALAPREAAAVVAGVQRGEIDEADLAALPAAAVVSLTLDFLVHDPDLLLDHARAAVTAHGAGHELNRADLGDAIAEVLLHSNPAVPSYLDHGIELVAQRTSTNPGGPVRPVRHPITLHAGPAAPAFTPPAGPSGKARR